MTHNKIWLLTILSLFFSASLFGQQELSKIAQADSLLRDYRFSEALVLYKEIATSDLDSIQMEAVQQKMLWCENGKGYLEYAATPSTINSKTVSRADFFRYFGKRNGTWMQQPNAFVPTDIAGPSSAILFPNQGKRIYFSAPDESGSWNIYSSEQMNDTLWTEPQLLNEHITSTGNEVFPMLSANGKELYFASNGLFGMGGYDLYVCHWDAASQDWGVPENLGFPYSSTEDDWMIQDTADGLYTLLASSRGCAQDSVNLYALAFTSNPLRHAVSSDQEARRIAALLPHSEEIKWKANEDRNRMTSFTQANDTTGQTDYKTLILQRRALEEKLEQMNDKLDESRANYNKQINEEDRRFFQEIITENEKDIFRHRQSLDEITRRIQKKELEFLSRGIIPIPEIDQPQEEAHAIDLPPYQFVCAAWGEMPYLTIHRPKPQFDYSFQILPQARFAEDNTLPDRLVYQIQLFVVSNKAGLRQLKGMSPVYERKQKSGKYVYTVGLFYTHAEALSCLNKVKKNGFPGAYIVAYDKGKEISVKTARQREKNTSNQTVWQLVLRGYPEGIPAGIVTAIHESCNKDVIKSSGSEDPRYIVTPFATKQEAERIRELLIGLGVEQIQVESKK